MAPPIRVPAAIKEQLRLALLDESDLLDFLAQAPREPLADHPGWHRCRCTLPVRRPLDPETSQLLQVEVRLRPVDDGWEIEAVQGLESP
jgi:hypothetical protein